MSVCCYKTDFIHDTAEISDLRNVFQIIETFVVLIISEYIHYSNICRTFLRLVIA